MKKMLFTLMLILFCFAHTAESAQKFPKSIVFVGGYWLGSTAGGEWKSAADFTEEMARKKDWVQAQWALEYPFPYPWGGESYALYGADGYLSDVEGEALHGEHAGEFHAKAAAYLGLSGLEGREQSPLPRRATVLSPKNATYEKILKDWLAKNGPPGAKPKISQLFKVDLEGDGVDEVLIVAQNILVADGDAVFWKPDALGAGLTDLVAPHAEKGMYSVVLLRKIVGGKVREIPLRSFFAKDGPGVHPIPEISRIYQFADLNGDGTLEIIAGDVSRRGHRYNAIEVLKDGTYVLVLSGGADY